MAADPEKKDGWIHRVDTVPPPAGEGDPYSAPTKVGPLSDDVIDAMRKAGVPEDMIPVSGVASSRQTTEEGLPRLYEAAEDEPPTLLHPSARRVAVAPAPAPVTLPAPAGPAPPVDDTRLLVVAVFASLVVGALAAFVTSLP